MKLVLLTLPHMSPEHKPLSPQPQVELLIISMKPIWPRKLAKGSGQASDMAPWDIQESMLGNLTHAQKGGAQL